MISTDGGRIRLREGGRRGRKGKGGRRRFRTPWREPKFVVAYVIDEKGRRDPAVLVIYDGTPGDADATFDLLVTELKLRGASKAKEIIMTADGARWIGDRAYDLARSLGLAPERIVKVADFYHGVEHLTHLTEHCTSWSDSNRSQWVQRMRRRLKRGHVEAILKEARTPARGRNAGKILTDVRYFDSRREIIEVRRVPAPRDPAGERGRRECDLPRRQPAAQGSFDHLARAERGTHAAPVLLPRGGPMDGTDAPRHAPLADRPAHPGGTVRCRMSADLLGLLPAPARSMAPS